MLLPRLVAKALSSKRAIQITFTLFFIIILTTNAIVLSVKEKTPMPLLKEIGGKFFGVNANINEELTRFQAVESPSIFKVILSVSYLFAEIWFIYIWFVVAMWISRRFNWSTDFGNFMLSLFIFVVISVIYQLVIYGLTDTVIFQPTSPSWWWTLFPFSGIINLTLKFPSYFNPFINLLTAWKVI